MCMYSAIGDNFKDQFPKSWPQIPIQPDVIHLPPEITRKEFDALKKEMQELKKLLKAAADFDKATGQPHCEVENKIKLIKQIAALVGVDIKDIE